MTDRVAGDHAVIIPTELGPVGGIVTEPAGERRGAMIFVQGLGTPGRAGVNSNWARLARDLAGLGLVVLRVDLCVEGESTAAGVGAERGEGWRRSTDLALLREVVPWFTRQSGISALLLAGSCHGGRVALELAATEPGIGGLFLVTPYLWAREPAKRDSPEPLPPPVWANGPTFDTEGELLEALATCVSRMPVWILVGGEEVEQVAPYAEGLERKGEPPFELEASPDIPLHPFGHPRQHELVSLHLLKRVARAL